MTIQFKERPESRARTEGESPTATLKYWADGSDDDDAVIAQAIASSPATWAGLVRQTINLDPQGADFWYIDIGYGKRKPGAYGDWKYSWDTTGGRAHITQSLETVHKVAVSGRTATDHHGAIGVTSDSIEGCEIVVPKFAFTISYYWNPIFLSIAYAKATAALTGTRNNAAFWGWSAGEVLFLGSNGDVENSGGSTSPVQVQYKFEADVLFSATVSGMSVVKEPHHYNWFEYLEIKDTDSKRVAKRPISNYTERCYLDASFEALGIS